MQNHKRCLHFSEFQGITNNGQNLLWLFGVYTSYQNFGAFFEAAGLHNLTMKLSDTLGGYRSAVRIKAFTIFVRLLCRLLVDTTSTKEDERKTKMTRNIENAEYRIKNCQ